MNIGIDEASNPALVRAWNSPLRWTLTSGKNLRRVVDTRGHAFVIVTKAGTSLSLYRSENNDGWIKVAECESIEDAKAALLTCALEVEVCWH